MLNLFTRVTVQTRLLIGFGAVIVMMIAITIIGINNVNAIDKAMTVITDMNSVKQRYAINFRGSVHDRAIAIRDVVLLSERSELQNTLRDIANLETFYNDSRVPLDQLMMNGSTAKEANILDTIKQIERKTMPLVKQVINEVQQGNKQQAQTLLLSSVRPAFVEWLAAINQFIDYQEVGNQQETKMVRETAAGFEGIMFALTSIAFLISGFIVYRIAHGLKVSLDGEPSEVARLLSRVADGDLTQKIEARYENSVLFSLKKTQNQLSSTVTNIAGASNEINSQIDIVSTGSADVLSLVQQQREYTVEATENLNDMRDKTYTVSELLVQTEQNSSQTLESCTLGSQSVNATATEIQNVLTTVSSALDKLQKLE